MAASGASCSNCVRAQSSGPGRPTLVIDATGASRTLVIFGRRWRETESKGEGTEREKEARALSIGSFVPVDPFFGVALIRKHRGSLEVICKMSHVASRFRNSSSRICFLIETFFLCWRLFRQYRKRLNDILLVYLHCT